MPPSKTGAVDSFQAVLADIVGATGLKLNVLAGKLGVSTKTIGRYFAGRAMPPAGRRHGIVHALSSIDAALFTRLTASLGVTADFPDGPPRAPVSPEAALATVEAALNELIKKLDCGPAKSRAAVAQLLGTLADANIDVKAARSLLLRK